MKKTIVIIEEVEDGVRTYYKSITLKSPKTKVWKALVSGAHSVLGIDVEEQRAKRIRKGGK